MKLSKGSTSPLAVFSKVMDDVWLAVRPIEISRSAVHPAVSCTITPAVPRRVTTLPRDWLVRPGTGVLITIVFWKGFPIPGAAKEEWAVLVPDRT